LSAIGVSLSALQESPGQVRDHVGLLVQSEVAGVEDVDLGGRRRRCGTNGLIFLGRERSSLGRTAS
jgi:hypothetical protein